VRVHDLEGQNAELRTRLAQYSANPHKLPASDGYQKKTLIRPALPKQPGKKPGGQAGHSGHTLEMIQQPDLMAHQCSYGCIQTGQFPAQVTAPVQYGPVPAARLDSYPQHPAQRRLPNPVYQSESAVGRVDGLRLQPRQPDHRLGDCFRGAGPIEEQIKGHLIQAPVCHFDETGVRLGDKLHWLHVACTPEYT